MESEIDRCDDLVFLVFIYKLYMWLFEKLGEPSASTSDRGKGYIHGWLRK